MSQFLFLEREWPAVLEAASRAETAAHADPRSACFYARRALELALDYAKGLGETPEVVHGKMLVRNDEGRIIARVPVEVWQMGQLSSSSAI